MDSSKLSVIRHSDFLWAGNGDFARAEDNTSLSTGTPTLGTVTGTVLSGFLIDADNEAIEATLGLPSYWDRRHDVEIYPLWVCDAAVADVGFTPSYASFAVAKAIPSLTAATVIVDSSASTSLLIDRAGDGSSVIPASAMGEGDHFLQLKIAVTDKSTLGSDLLWLLGAELVYTPRWGHSKLQLKGRERSLA